MTVSLPKWSGFGIYSEEQQNNKYTFAEKLSTRIQICTAEFIKIIKAIRTTIKENESKFIILSYSKSATQKITATKITADQD